MLLLHASDPMVEMASCLAHMPGLSRRSTDLGKVVERVILAAKAHARSYLLFSDLPPSSSQTYTNYIVGIGLRTTHRWP